MVYVNGKYSLRYRILSLRGLSATPTLPLPHRGREPFRYSSAFDFCTSSESTKFLVRMREQMCAMPPICPLPRGGLEQLARSARKLGWGQQTSRTASFLYIHGSAHGVCKQAMFGNLPFPFFSNNGASNRTP